MTPMHALLADPLFKLVVERLQAIGGGGALDRW